MVKRKKAARDDNDDEWDESSEMEVASKGGFSSLRTLEQVSTGVTGDAHSGLFGGKDFGELPLKKDHELRPIWVAPDGHIYLETFSPIYLQAYDFLIAIAEPVCRPRLVHEYKLTPYSLYAAVSIGLETDDIIGMLGTLSKVPVAPGIAAFIRKCTLSYGKARLVLKENKYYIESAHPAVLQQLLRDELIAAARVTVTAETAALLEKVGESGVEAALQATHDALVTMRAPRRDGLLIGGIDLAAEKAKAAAAAAAKAKQQQQNAKGKESANGSAASVAPVGRDAPAGVVATPAEGDSGAAGDALTAGQKLLPDDLKDLMGKLEAKDDRAEEAGGQGDGSGGGAQVQAFQLHQDMINEVKKQCRLLDYPLLEEYDFRHDSRNPDLDMHLKPTTALRDYQEKSLSKMFGNGRARSGIIVLPCGAGKTLVGVTATATVKKATLVLTTSAVAVEQWRNQYKLWSTIGDDKVACFTAAHKEGVANASIVVSTYTMMAYTGQRAHDARQIFDQLCTREWGLMIMDEVHVVPANIFRRVLEAVGAHCKLGLTATLVREDDKITDLNFLIGPKLYEANWLDLQEAGHIARVSCSEVWCTMTPEFYRKYLEAKSRKKQLLFVMNPTKFQVCQWLVRYHERRGDKIIVFSDNLFALKKYAMRMDKPYICGAVAQQERMFILKNFQHNPQLNTVFISKVGDNAIDLPMANVLIQISSHYGSRRQEAQRLGRILRAKKDNVTEEFNAFFYSLVSKDTTEMYFSAKRQQFLVDQGYAFKILTKLPIENDADLGYSTEREQRELLTQVLTATADDLLDDEEDAPDTISFSGGGRGGGSGVSRKAGSMANLSGAGGLTYMESTVRGANKNTVPARRNKLFRDRAKAAKAASSGR